MDVQEALSEAGGAMTAKRVYAEPYVHNGLTIIPAAAADGEVEMRRAEEPASACTRRRRALGW